MTRKDYIQIAAALHAVQPAKTGSADKHAQFEMTVHMLADCLHEDNPRFDYTRFYEACGLVQPGPGEGWQSLYEHSSACDCRHCRRLLTSRYESGETIRTSAALSR